MIRLFISTKTSRYMSTLRIHEGDNYPDKAEQPLQEQTTALTSRRTFQLSRLLKLPSYTSNLLDPFDPVSMSPLTYGVNTSIERRYMGCRTSHTH